MALRQDLPIRQGETWQFAYVHKDATGVPIDLTGWSARMSVRDQVGGVLEASLSSEPGEQQAGAIGLANDGTVTLSMTAAQSRRLTDNLVSASVLIEHHLRNTPEVSFVYDLELEDGAGNVTRALEGRVIVSREITT